MCWLLLTMNNQETAQKIKSILMSLPPSKRSGILEPISNKLDLSDFPMSEDTMNWVDGLGEVAMKEMILSLGLWLVAEGITTFESRYDEEDW